MSGLLYLTSEDFFVSKGTKGNILCHSIKGFSLILFYSTQCVHCQKIIPIFKRLPGSIGGCQFGMVNISKSKEVVKMSQDTIAPLTYVPYIILYINNKPWMRYDGPYDENEIKKFIIEVSKRLQSKTQFMTSETETTAGGATIKNTGRGIPAYTIGKPLYGEGEEVCYLEYKSAYDINQKK
jgi:hypothetical protein